MKKFIQNIIKKQAKAILRKYQPKVIGITGSIGKTSTRDAVLAVIKNSFDVRASIKNYNNEFGVPLTIIGATSPGKSIIGWLLVLIKSWTLIAFTNKKYPKVLLLEMGADKAGDIKYLVDLAPCDIGVLTNIGPSHLEHFSTIDKVAREKKYIVSHLSKTGTAILNADNEKVVNLKNNLKASVLTFGFSEESDISIVELETSGSGLEVDGLKFKLVYQGSAVPIYIPEVIGKNAIMASLAAAAVGISLGMNLVEISEGLKNFKTPSGRMKLIPGIKHTLLIDDSYNASPESTIAGLEVLAKLELPEQAKRFAVLGDMLELGAFTDDGHKEVGDLVAKLKIDILITVGGLGVKIAKAAEKSGMVKDQIFSFDDSVLAGRFLQDRMKKGDLVYIKGSQGVRMEKITKEVMAEPNRASELLVRQGKQW